MCGLYTDINRLVLLTNLVVVHVYCFFDLQLSILQLKEDMVLLSLVVTVFSWAFDGSGSTESEVQIHLPSHGLSIKKYISGTHLYG